MALGKGDPAWPVGANHAEQDRVLGLHDSTVFAKCQCHVPRAAGVLDVLASGLPGVAAPVLDWHRSEDEQRSGRLSRHHNQSSL